MPIPKGIAFAGHMIDQPNREPERFPPRLVEGVRQTLKQCLAAQHALIGCSSAACGADLLFQQAIQEPGGKSLIVSPYDRYELRAESVEFAGEEWTQLFETVVDRATQVITTSPQKMQPVAFPC